MHAKTPIVFAGLLLLAGAGCPGKDKQTTKTKGATKATKTTKTATKTATKTGDPSGKAAAKTQDAIPSGPLTAEAVLRWAPASADAVATVRDLGALYRLLGDVQGALGSLPAGAQLLEHAKAISRSMPVPVPWKASELAGLGIDANGALALIVRKPQVFLLLPITDAAKLKAAMAKVGRWSKAKAGGLELDRFEPRRGRPVSCHFTKSRAYCSARADTLAALLKETKRPDSVWKRLSETQRAAANKSTGFFWLKQRRFDLFATANVTNDGLALTADVHSLALARPAKMLAGVLAPETSQSALLGLAEGSTSRAFLRLPLAALARMLAPRGRGPFAALIGDPKNFTGELLAIERPGAQLALVLGTHDQAQAQKLVERLAKVLRTQLAKAKKKRKKRGPKVTVKDRRIAGQKAYLLEIKGGKRVPINFRWGLAVGPLGIAIGSYKLVEELAQTKKGDAKAFLASLGPEDRSVYGKGMILGLQLAVGDPLQGIAGKLEETLGKQLPQKARAMISLGRFMMDQLDHISLGQAQVSPQKMRLAASIHTLHRTGNSADDAAREVWRKALAAKYAGDIPTFEKALVELTQNHKKTRYAALQKRQQGALFTTMSGLLAAVAIPAFTQYTRRAKSIEARLNISMARMGLMRHARSTNALPKGDSGWTPKERCCKKPRGYCVRNPTLWPKNKMWKALGFQVRSRSYFQYRYMSKGKNGFVLQARGDLDCDGTYSLFTVKGKLDGGRIRAEPLKVENEGE